MSAPEHMLRQAFRDALEKVLPQSMAQKLAEDAILNLDALDLADRYLRLIDILRVQHCMKLSYLAAEALAISDRLAVERGCRDVPRTFDPTTLEDGMILSGLLDFERYLYRSNNEEVIARIGRLASECGRVWTGLPHPDQNAPQQTEG